MKKSNLPIVYRGEIWYADLSPVIGSEQGGVRPVLIVQNDVGNRNAPTTIIAPITSRLSKHPLPTHVPLPSQTCGITSDSIALMEQLRTIDKQRLKTRMGVVPKDIDISTALKVSLGLE